MDLFVKLIGDLEPLGGDLFIDAFIEARRSAAASRQRASTSPSAAPEAVRMRAGDPDRAPKASAETMKNPAASAESEAGTTGDTGGLRAEVQAFLNRDEAEGTNEDEVQLFLKERSGFDPTELE